jgi:hypothetical protein
MYFSQHMNRGKCFALFAKHIAKGTKERSDFFEAGI